MHPVRWLFITVVSSTWSVHTKAGLLIIHCELGIDWLGTQENLQISNVFSCFGINEALGTCLWFKPNRDDGFKLMEGLACPLQPRGLLLDFSKFVFSEVWAVGDLCQETTLQQVEGKGTPVFVLVPSCGCHHVSKQGKKGGITCISYLVCWSL